MKEQQQIQPPAKDAPVNEKAKYLKYLDTKNLINKQTQLEDELEQLLIEEAKLKNDQYGYLGSENVELKTLEAELYFQAEGTNETQRKAWVSKQLKDHPDAIRIRLRQKVAAFDLDNLHIKIEMTKRRLDSIKGVIALKTAQLNFLS